MGLDIRADIAKRYKGSQKYIIEMNLQNAGMPLQSLMTRVENHLLNVDY